MRFVVADLHLGHKGVTQFLRADGSKLRPWDDIDKMNTDMIQYWNETVNVKDTSIEGHGYSLVEETKS